MELIQIPELAPVPEIGMSLRTGYEDLNDSYQYSSSGKYTIYVPVNLDGREIGKRLQRIHEKKLRNRRQGRTERKAGELMYNFVDTTERYPGQNLPSEALMFNGSYLENVIPGYRTLYVFFSGREIWVRRLQIWNRRV